MGKKGEETKSLIKQKAYNLFSKKGFKEVTMKDICQATGLSRGGLYRHYESTEQIFSEIMDRFLDVQNSDFMREINNNTPASVILETILTKYKKEMLDTEGSLSMAIFEFFSKKNILENGNILSKQYQASFDSWNTLIQYGIKTGEFHNIDTRCFFDLLVFSYQGVRMYSQLMVIGEDIPERIVSQLKKILLVNTERSSNMNEEEIVLVKPTKELESQALDYRQEHFSNGENVINGSELFDKILSYDEWLDKVSKNSCIETVQPDWVLTDTFFALRKSDYKIVGIIDLRYELNDFLKDFGNCGYSVRPTERRKGYAAKMLKELCTIAKAHGLKRLQLSVEKHNAASIRTIEKNGGIYERSFCIDNEEADVYIINL